MSNKLEKLRNKYKPTSELRVLLVGKAPPRNSFFYETDTNADESSLFVETARAIYPEKWKKFKKEILQEMKEEGFYLIDILGKPADKNQKISANEIENTKGVINKLNPHQTILIGKKEVGKVLKNKNCEILPFPSNIHKHKEEYRVGLRRIVKKIRGQ